MFAATETLVRAGDVDAIHRARVATRQLRANLDTFRPIFDSGLRNSLADDVRSLTRALGTVRDLDVLLLGLERLTATVATIDARSATALFAGARREREAAFAHLLEHLASPTYAALRVRLDELAAHPPLRATVDPGGRAEPFVREQVRRSLRSLARRTHRLGRRPDTTQWHELRKQVKQARYGAVALADLSQRRRDRRAIPVLADAQEVLGRGQDDAHLIVWLRVAAHADTPGDAGAFTAGVLVGHLLAAPPVAGGWRRTRRALRDFA